MNARGHSQIIRRLAARRWEPGTAPVVSTGMKLAGTLLLIGMGALAGIAAAAETAKPAVPDPEYCARRDADPEKCIIQDGPHRPIAKKKPVVVPLPENPPADKPSAKR